MTLGSTPRFERDYIPAAERPELTESLFDCIVTEIYEAAAAGGDWLKPLNRIAEALDQYCVHFLALDKSAGTFIFSYEAGSLTPEGSLQYLCAYQHLDPRAAHAMTLPPQTWFACQEVFDETFVSADPFYQDFLIPIGGRYLFGGKLAEDEHKAVLLGLIGHRGNPPLDHAQRNFVERIGRHVAESLKLRDALRDRIERSAIGYELLERMRQPIILVDANRNITFRNAAAKVYLDEADLLIDDHGTLICTDSAASVQLSVSVRELGLISVNSNERPDVRTDRRSVRLRRRGETQNVVVTLIAIRPERTSGAFGSAPQALLTVYEPGRLPEPDPFLLSATFDLTPAEARLAARLCAGASLAEIADAFAISQNTVKSQLQAVFAKTGARRQADLVNLLNTAANF